MAPGSGGTIDQVRDVLSQLERVADPTRLPGMARFGIATDKALGVSMPDLRRIAQRIGRDHALALRLWDTGVHEARILAGLIDDPARVTSAQMEAWVRDFDSWDLCDQVCGSLFDRTRFAFGKAALWSGHGDEFVKRAGFALMAWAAVHRKEVGDEVFEKLLPIIRGAATDERNYVKKAVSWALRQIGKRSPGLNAKAVATAEEIRALDSKAARWIASNALRELTSDAVRERLRGTRGR